MEEQNTAAPPQELVRPLEDRMLAGVAIAFANRLNIPGWVVRVAFILTTAAAGLGLVLYVSCWAVLRSEDEDESPATRFFSRATSAQSWVGIGLIFLAMMFLLDRYTFVSTGVIWAGALLVAGVLLYFGQIPFPATQPKRDESGGAKEGVQQMTTGSNVIPVDVSPVGTSLLVADETATKPKPPKEAKPPKEPKAPKPPRETSPLGRLTIGMMFLAIGVLAALDLTTNTVNPTMRHYLALATTVLGLGLLVGSVWGRARYLILIGVVLVPTLVLTPFAGFWQGQSTLVSPTSFADLQSSYNIDVGRLTVNLVDLPWNGEEVELGVSADVGEITVWVPGDVAVSGSASVDVGSVSVPGVNSGWGVTSRTFQFDNPGYPEADQGWGGDGTTRGRLRIVASVDVGSIGIWHEYVERNSQ